VSLRTFYNQFVQALGRTTIANIDIIVHPQADGGAIFEAVITDSEGRKFTQKLHAPMAARKKFGDRFLIDDFKAGILEADTARFRQHLLSREKKPLLLEIETTDPDFLEDLRKARINGLEISFSLNAAADVEREYRTARFNIKFNEADAARVFGEWLHDRIIGKTSHKITINQTDVSKNPNQIGIIIHNYIEQLD